MALISFKTLGTVVWKAFNLYGMFARAVPNLTLSLAFLA